MVFNICDGSMLNLSSHLPCHMVLKLCLTAGLDAPQGLDDGVEKGPLVEVNDP